MTWRIGGISVTHFCPYQPSTLGSADQIPLSYKSYGLPLQYNVQIFDTWLTTYMQVKLCQVTLLSLFIEIGISTPIHPHTTSLQLRLQLLLLLFHLNFQHSSQYFPSRALRYFVYEPHATPQFFVIGYAASVPVHDLLCRRFVSLNAAWDIKTPSSSMKKVSKCCEDIYTDLPAGATWKPLYLMSSFTRSVMKKL